VDPVIRTRQDAFEAVEAYSPAEQQFNRRRRTVGVFLGPLVMLAVLLAPIPLKAPAHKLAGVMALMFVYWVSEALPVAVTALLGPLLVVLLRIAPAKDAFAPFADPIIFLFLGSFILAEAMYVHRLDRRIAFTALAQGSGGASPARILVLYGAVAAGVSAWVSNTATAAMLYPVGLSLVKHLAAGPGVSAPAARRFAMVMMLMTAFAASIGGIATPIGTPPNLIGLGMLHSLAGVHVTFTQWMLLGVPLAIVLYGVLAVWLTLGGTRGVAMPRVAIAQVKDELRTLGPVSVGERNVMLAFGVTVALWLLPGVLGLLGGGETTFVKAFTASVPESVAALVGAVLLFVLPVDRRSRKFTMTWEQAAHIDWGTILLFGGGLSIGAMAFSTGLAEALGRALTSWLPTHSTAAYTALFTGLAILLSETTSNTAAASMLVPVAIAVSQSAGIRPIEPALGVTLGASMGFMLPISTPPNAIAYSSGHIPITAMMRYGAVLDLLGFIIIVAAVLIAGPLIF
jgi:solute carrier family 13 (sodium-dependent dicarboxylate transporter), member 2/3/5